MMSFKLLKENGPEIFVVLCLSWIFLQLVLDLGAAALSGPDDTGAIVNQPQPPPPNTGPCIVIDGIEVCDL